MIRRDTWLTIPPERHPWIRIHLLDRQWVFRRNLDPHTLQVVQQMQQAAPMLHQFVTAGVPVTQYRDLLLTCSDFIRCAWADPEYQLQGCDGVSTLGELWEEGWSELEIISAASQLLAAWSGPTIAFHRVQALVNFTNPPEAG